MSVDYNISNQLTEISNILTTKLIKYSYPYSLGDFTLILSKFNGIDCEYNLFVISHVEMFNKIFQKCIFEKPLPLFETDEEPETTFFIDPDTERIIMALYNSLYQLKELCSKKYLSNLATSFDVITYKNTIETSLISPDLNYIFTNIPKNIIPTFLNPMTNLIHDIHDFMKDINNNICCLNFHFHRFFDHFFDLSYLKINLLKKLNEDINDVIDLQKSIMNKKRTDFRNLIMVSGGIIATLLLIERIPYWLINFHNNFDIMAYIYHALLSLLAPFHSFSYNLLSLYLLHILNISLAKILPYQLLPLTPANS
jgi:hypothetical protein